MIDRSTALKQADKLFRRERLDRATAQYVRLAAHQPRDWHAPNARGDLYMRAGEYRHVRTRIARLSRSQSA
jgi:Flp pilus assembly protein TadD